MTRSAKGIGFAPAFPLKSHTPAERARLQAGYSLEAAARKVNLSPRYLRQIERQGQAPLKTARRLAHVYNCSGNLFLHSPNYLAQLGQRAAELSCASHAAAGADTRINPRASRRYQPPRSPMLLVVSGAQEQPNEVNDADNK